MEGSKAGFRPIVHTNEESELPVIPGYRYQLSRESFNFDIVLKSRCFKQYVAFAEKHGLVRDVCDPSLSTGNPALSVEQFINVEQKSETWFALRSAADGTASSVGKKIKGPTMYPTIEQVSEYWSDMIQAKPFEVTHTMRGHMKWGVGYEDPALIHFAVDNHLSVAQVGTIYMPLSYVFDDLGGRYFGGTLKPWIEPVRAAFEQCDGVTGRPAHLIVSPDGLVGTPDDGPYGELPRNLVGMLEIKCISPFHHVEERDGTLTWVDDMETRQWHHAGQIPFVYMTQICMQAMSGLYRLDMTEDHTMWFMRWSPIGFSEFKIKFQPLIRMGVVATLLYYTLKQRIKTMEDLPLVYTKSEMGLYRLLTKEYKNICSLMQHRYIKHETIYPEFLTYRDCTRYHKFVVREEG